MDNEKIKYWIEKNLLMQADAMKITGQNASTFNQSVRLGKIVPFVKFGGERKTSLYLKSDLEAYVKNKKKANAALHTNVLIVSGKKQINAVVFDKLAFERLLRSFPVFQKINMDTVLITAENEKSNIKIYARYDNEVIAYIPEHSIEENGNSYDYTNDTYDLELYINGRRYDFHKYYNKLVMDANHAARSSDDVYMKAISKSGEGYITKQGLFFTEKTEWKYDVLK